MICPQHNKELRSGKFGLFCPSKMEDGSWCKYKGEQTGYQTFQKNKPAAPTSTDKMSKEDWEAKEARTNKNILLQVAFKKVYEQHGKEDAKKIADETLYWYKWLLSQTEGQQQSFIQPLGIPQPSPDEAMDYMSSAYQEPVDDLFK